MERGAERSVVRRRKQLDKLEYISVPEILQCGGNSMERITQSLGKCVGDIVFHKLVIGIRARAEMVYS